MSKLLVIIGSTRPTRSADLVLPWLTEKVSQHPAFDAEIVDLRDWPLPIFAEHPGTLGDINDPTYSEPLVRAWNKKVKQADAFIVITPEYNHSFPAPLKTAIDWYSKEWHARPVAFVAYGGNAGGLRAVEQLRQVFAELHSVTVRNAVGFSMAWEHFDEAGRLRDPARHEKAAGLMLDQLAWWGRALKQARSIRPYPA